MNPKKRFVITLVILGLLATGTAFVVAQVTDEHVIYACVNNNDGTLRLVNEDTTCKKSEYEESWMNAGSYAGLQATVIALETEVASQQHDIDFLLAIRPKIVFVTSQGYSGALGGLAGADAICAASAAAGGLHGTFKAWLSDDSESPSTRFRHSLAPYLRPDGVKIANDWADLLVPPLDTDIRVDEFGAYRTESGDDSFVWTATTDQGGPHPNENCNGWTSNDAANRSASGGMHPEYWTTGSFPPCNWTARLYCFEQ